MTSSAARLPRDDSFETADEAPPPAPPRGAPEGSRAKAARPGTLRLVIAGRATPAAALPRAAEPAPLRAPREAARVTAHRAVLDVAGAVVSRRASDRDLGLQVRRALAAGRPEPEAGRTLGPLAGPFDLIHASPAFCLGEWTRPHCPAQLARPCRRGPLPDCTRSVILQRLGGLDRGAIVLTPRTRGGPLAGLALAALRATASDEDLGAAVREALALSR
jgi:hypothetical protein